MATDLDSRELPLVTEFNTRSEDKQWGYQKLDELTVLLRKQVPLFTSEIGETSEVMLTLYDFSSFEVTKIVHPLSSAAESAQNVVTKSFSEVEGKQSIRDAHRALTALGGTPPPLDDVLGVSMELKDTLQVSGPLKLRQQG